MSNVLYYFLLGEEMTKHESRQQSVDDGKNKSVIYDNITHLSPLFNVMSLHAHAGETQ